MADVAMPVAVVSVEEAVGEGLAAGDDVAERVEEAAFIVARRVEIGAITADRERCGAAALDQSQAIPYMIEYLLTQYS